MIAKKAFEYLFTAAAGLSVCGGVGYIYYLSKTNQTNLTKLSEENNQLKLKQVKLENELDTKAKAIQHKSWLLECWSKEMSGDVDESCPKLVLTARRR